ncbi:P-loop containing nucleoside triphosphate hydrolase protein [Pisolithus croceorrhizus]|nr:P-loop containing nucleoside triphosphate hydrolase protein [Pisolithus croceorrhizus]
MPTNRNGNRPSVSRPSVYPRNLRERVEMRPSHALMSSVTTLRMLVPTSAIKSDDVVILVMGKTGSGMSNFINKLTGMQPEEGADQLFSRTQDVCAYECYRNGQRFIFVDTPGFNNGKLPSSAVFRAIAMWLEETYRHSIKLTGVIYTHDIRDDGRCATDVQSFRLLSCLCGNEAADRIRLVTTMWDEVDESEAVRMEETLRRTHWQPLIRARARIKRFHNTPDTAWDIVRDLGSTKKALLLQREMVDMRKKLGDTTAGKCLGESKPWWKRLLGR